MDSDTQHILVPILIGVPAITLFVMVFWWFDRRSKIILQKWADSNGFQILQKTQQYMIFTGPFKFWTNSRNQIIYWLECVTSKAASGQDGHAAVVTLVACFSATKLRLDGMRVNLPLNTEIGCKNHLSASRPSHGTSTQ